MASFEEQLYGLYDVPESVKQVENSSGFYEHPEGIYIGRIGSMDFKFVNMEKKPCKSSDPSATAARAVLKIYLTKYLGKADSPQEIQLLNPDLTLPHNKTSYELYYPLSMSLAQKYQWLTVKLFDKFVVPDISDSAIVEGKMVRYKKMQLYYGLEVKFELKKNGKYTNVENMVQLDTPRAPIEAMKQLEVNFGLLQEQEREARTSESSTPRPDASVDDILGDFSPADARPNEVEDDGADLPF